MLRRRTVSRFLASIASAPVEHPPTYYQVFDRHAKRLQKDRSASRDNGELSRTVDYVRDQVANNMFERIMDIKRQFSHVVEIGSGAGHLTRLLEKTMAPRVTMIDLSERSLKRDSDSEFEVDITRKVLDEEVLLHHFERGSVPAALSCLSLHWTNDLPGVLYQIRELLQPDGVFIGAMFGGDTLFELRTSLQLAELEREGGISIRVSPMTDTRDVTSLLSRAGFTLTTVDIDEVTVSYPSMFELIEDLRAMGESNAVVERRTLVTRDSLAAASAIYKELHGLEDGNIPATFQIIYMIGWRPGPDQKKPLERGSGKTNLKDVL